MRREEIEAVVREVVGRTLNDSGTNGFKHATVTAVVDAIASRVADKLARLTLNDEERATLEWLRKLADMGIFESLELTDPLAADHSGRCRKSVALIDRLLGARP